MGMPSMDSIMQMGAQFFVEQFGIPKEMMGILGPVTNNILQSVEGGIQHIISAPKKRRANRSRNKRGKKHRKRHN